MRVSKNFTYSEATHSNKALELGIDNTPNEVELANIKIAALGMECVRRLFGDLSIVPSSWFRKPETNKAVGGSATSSHMQGYSVDFNCIGFGNLQAQFDAIKNSSIAFDKLVIERAGGKEWIHISFDPRLRQEAYSYDGQSYERA